MNSTKYLLITFLLFFFCFSVHAKNNTICKDDKIKEEMSWQTTCVYKGKTLSDAYAQAVKEDLGDDGKVLKPKLPAGNLKYEYAKDSLKASVEYRKQSKTKTIIAIRYGGGENTWTIIQTPSATKIVFYNSAD